MNEKFQELALKAGVLNYIDNETPREYFISGAADTAELEDYGRMILQEVFRIMQEQEKIPAGFQYGKGAGIYISAIKNEFGIL
jgi:hypothetical protein